MKKDPWVYVIAGAVVLVLFGFGFAQTDSLKVNLGFSGGLAVALGLLAGIAWLFLKGVKNVIPKGLPFAWRYGIANLYRPNNRSVLMLVALGLGFIIVLSLFLTKEAILKQLIVDRGGNNSNMILFDIQPHQLADVETVIEDNSLPVIEAAPLVNMRISELKGQEGKIIVPFTPGSQIIQVRATLDQTVEQRFIVDTGASTVTIPSATAERLGIDLDSDYPVRSVTTAAGIIEAPEVVLPSIKLDDWEVADITALVIDIPNQPDLGLLGLNFLERFRMDLNTEKGILILEPR